MAAPRGVPTRLTAWLLALCIAGGTSAQDASTPPPQIVSLRVLDLDGKPIQGAGVAIAGASEPTTDEALQQPLAQSDRDGNLSFPVTVPAGPLAHARFLLAAKGHASIAFAWCQPRQPSSPSRLQVIHLYPGTTLRGRVRDADGKPVAGARVGLCEPFQIATLADVGATISSVTTTDADGIYALAGAPAGPCRLTVSKPGYYAEQLFPVWADTPSSPVLHRSGYVSGKLIGLDPRDCRVALHSSDPAAVYLTTPALAADGRFRFPLANRGPVHLQVYDERGIALADTELHGPAAGIELRPATHPLRVAVTFAGKPVSKFTVQPAWGAQFEQEIDWHIHFPTCLRGSDGVDGAAALAMPTSVDCGLLQVLADGCAIAQVSVSANDVREVKCELQPAASVAGIVTDENGAPVAGARVCAQRLQPTTSSDNYALGLDPALTSADGRFCIDNLPTGRFSVIVDDPHFEVPQPLTCKVAVGEHEVLAPVTLRRLGEIRGKLHGRLPAGALIAIAFEDRCAEIATDGRFVLPSRQHEAQPLVLRLPPSHPASSWIELPLGSFTTAAAEQVVEVADAEPATLRGAFQSKFVAPMRSWRIVALIETELPCPWPCAYADVGSDGRFTMRLGPGNYWLGVVDLGSGVVLYRHSEMLKMSSAQQNEVKLAPELHRVDIELRLPAGERLISGALQMHTHEPARKSMPEFMMLRADFNQGLPLVSGQSQLRLYLPAERYTVSVLAYTPAPQAEGGCDARLGQESFTVGGDMTVPLPLSPRPAAAK